MKEGVLTLMYSIAANWLLLVSECMSHHLTLAMEEHTLKMLTVV
jgi:hypothetical protein